MVYPYWHPDGRYCAFSTNTTRQGFHELHDKRIEVFDLQSDIFVYDTETGQSLTDSTIASQLMSENTPAFSPDGQWLYFTTAKQQTYPQGLHDQLYDLCRIRFNPGDGTFGSTVDTLFKASVMHKSATWPRPSYDGRHLLFTLADYGYFAIWHPESDQWILDLKTLEARPTSEINSNDADSFHNWSSNSHWVVFTSRRLDGLYSHLYIAECDTNGVFSKPFLLPQRHPTDYYHNSLFSFNTPDFSSSPVVQ